jgi:Fe-Mn family superoxide dismutase
MFVLPELPYPANALAPAMSNEKKLFNNAAQAWNHGLYWVSMTPAHTQPSAALAKAVEQAFGGHDKLREQFVAEGVNHFASGWVWLVLEGGALKVISTHDADDTLVRPGVKPLIVCDLWEHAYYLDTKNDRKTFLERWFDQLANWEFASKQLDAALAGHKGWEYPARTREHA